MSPPIYCDDDDIAALLPADATTGVLAAVFTRAKSRASRTLDSYLQAHFTLPLVTWGDDVRGHTAAIAAFYILIARGTLTDDPSVAIYVKAHDDAIAWCTSVAKGLVVPTGITDSSGDPDEDAAETMYPDASAGVRDPTARRGW